MCRCGLPCNTNWHSKPADPLIRVQLQLQAVEDQFVHPEPSAPLLPPPAFAPGTEWEEFYDTQVSSLTYAATQTDEWSPGPPRNQGSMLASALLAASIICSILAYQPIIERILGISLLDLYRNLTDTTQSYKYYDTADAFHSVRAHPAVAPQPTATPWHLYAIIALLAAALIMALGTSCFAATHGQEWNPSAGPF